MAGNELFIQGKKFISLKRASELSGYAKDYVGQLCRCGKIKSERIGRDWFVDLEDLLCYKKNKIESIKKVLQQKESSVSSVLVQAPLDGKIDNKNKDISSRRVIEIGAIFENFKNKASGFFSTKDSWDKELFEGRGERLAAKFAKSLAYGFAVILLIFGFVRYSSKAGEISDAYLATIYSTGDALTSFSVGASNKTVALLDKISAPKFNAAGAFSSITKNIFTETKNSFALFPQNVKEIVSEFLGLPAQTGVKDFFAPRSELAIEQNYNESVYQQEINSLKLELSQIKNNGFTVQSPIVQKTVVEKSVERIISGLTSEEIDARLNETNEKLMAQILDIKNRLAYRTDSIANATVASTYQAVALTNKIDSLSGVTINNATITGTLGGLTDAMIPDSITASNYLLLSGGTISGELTVTATTTFNGVAYGWPSADGSASYVLSTNGAGVLSWVAQTGGGGGGTVTSVAMSVPTGLAISGSPITTAGTLALTYDIGYAGVLTASTTNWNTFYDTPSNRITAGDYIDWSGNTLNVVGTLPVSIGGTGLTSYTSGDVLYANTTSTLAGTSTANLKTTLGLNLVENTALSSWVGSSAITTLGTIGTGVWNAGAVTSSGAITGTYFVATGAAATSTFAGGLTIETSGFVYDYSTNNVGIGKSNPSSKLDVAGSINISAGSYYKYNGANFAMADTNLNNYFTAGAGNLTMTGTQNNAMGMGTLGVNTTGNYNAAGGLGALSSNTTGGSNTAFGRAALYNNISGSYNIAVGGGALYSNTASNNTAVGYGSGVALTSGANNTFLGYQAGDNLTTGASNIVIGYDIDAPLVSSANTLNIGNLLFGTGIDGTGTTLSSGKIGIGTTSPYAKLSVVGQAVAEYFTATSTTATSTFPWLASTRSNVGTVIGGTWNGAAIADDYISSAAAWNAKQAGDADLTAIAALANTKGNLIVGGPSSAWVALGIGADGKVLTASSTATDGISWEVVAGGGGGTVTSVAMSVPTGLAISGSPITTAGTLALTYDIGYAGVLTASTTEWATAYGWGNHAGLYEAPLTFNYPLTRSANAISTVATSSLNLLVNSFLSPNISQWTNDANYLASAITSLGGQTGATQTFATSSDTNIGLTITSSGNIHTFTSNWIGSLAVSRGGTGLTSYTLGDVLYANTTSTLAGTSTANLKTTLGLNLVENTALSSWVGSSAITTLGTITSGTIGAGFTAIADDYISSAATWNAKWDALSDISLAKGYFVVGDDSGLAQATSSIFISSTGNIGIGTTTPYSILSISNSASTAINTPLFTIASTTAGVSTSTLFTVLANGNVGIGTVSPNNLIQVADLINFNNTDYNSLLGYQAGKNVVSGAQYNTFLGYQAGYSNTAAGNTFLGYSAGYANTSAAGSVAIGYQAGDSMTIGGYNVVIGYQAGQAMSAGTNNTFIGYQAGYLSTSNYSTFVGSNAGDSTTAGTYNTFVGMSAGQANVSGGKNTYLGYESGYFSIADFNTFIGYQSGYSSSTASTITADYNTAIGHQTLYSNTTGYSNSAMGYNALNANTTGGANSAVGTSALLYNTTGNNNTAIGGAALYSNTEGSQNSAMGYYALRRNQTGSANTAMGMEAGYGVINNSFASSTLIGYRAGYGLTTGSNNILLGYQAGDNLTTGANNIIIGYDIDAPLASSANTLNIGNLIFGTGIDGTGTTLSTGNIGIGTTSPYAKLSVVGQAVAEYFIATSTTATSTFPWLASTRSNVGTVIGGIWQGTAIGDTYISSAAAWNAKWDALSDISLAKGYFMVGNDAGLAQATSSIFVSSTGNIGIGTTTPYSILSISNSASTAINTPLFTIASTTAGVSTSTLFTVLANGNVGIGTVSPNNLIQVADLINFNNTDYNSLLGYQAGKNVVSGAQYNTFLGYQSGYSSSTASTNAADWNTGIGSLSLYSNTTGYSNVAVGDSALYTNTTGYYNAAVGTAALYSNTTGYSNVAVGDTAMYVNTSGYRNIAMGDASLSANTTGYYNVALGYQSLYTNNTGYSNVAVGDSALYVNTTGRNNIALGNRSLYGNTTGSANTAIGQETGYGGYSISFASSTLLGYRAGYGLTTGSNNILLGYQAGDNLTTGASNIIIGYDIDAPLASSANTLNIGNLIFGTGIDGTGTTLSSGKIGIGTTSPQALLTVGSSTLAYLLDGDRYNSLFVSGLFEIGGTGTSTMAGNLDIKGALNVGASSLYIDNTGTIKSGTWQGTLIDSTYISSSASWNNKWDLASTTIGVAYGGTGLTSVTAGYALIGYNSSSFQATSTLFISPSGNVGIGTIEPTYKLDIYDVSNPQLGLINIAGSATTTFWADSVGDLRISASGGDIRAQNENIWVCSGGACGATAPAGKGNMILERALIFDNNFNIVASTTAAATSTEVYDSGGNAIIIFDEEQ